MEKNTVKILSSNEDCPNNNQFIGDQSQSSPEDGEIITETDDLFTISFSNKQHYIKYGTQLAKIILEHLKDEENDYQHQVLNHREGIHMKFSSNSRATETTTQESRSCQMPPPLPKNVTAAQPQQLSTPQISPLLAKILLAEEQKSSETTDLGNLFCIDTKPIQRFDTSQIPSYDRTTNDGLIDGEFAAQKKLAEEKKALKRKFMNVCFNCGKVGHGTKTCNLPLNHKRIQESKRSQTKLERYCDIEKAYNHIKPGVLSTRLRRALGLRENELPFFYYRMRLFGYPPGWLADSKVEHSGIKLFDYNENGKESLDKSKTKSQNNLSSQSGDSKQPSLYNMSEFINFPGFNKYPGKKYPDEYLKYNVPPFNQLQSNKEFIKRLGCKVFQGYKRQKLSNDTINSNVDTECNIETTDMEIVDSSSDVDSIADESDVEQIKDDNQFIKPKVQHITTNRKLDKFKKDVMENVCITIDSDDESETESLSLSYLERKQNDLLDQLEEISSIDSSTITSDSTTGKEKTVQRNENNSEKRQDSGFSSESNMDIDGDVKHKEELLNVVEQKTTPVKNVASTYKQNGINRKTEEVAIGTSTNVHMGTPILKFTPYETLPTNENFKVGVSDVINFENLTNSTGKYVQMQKVLQKVRTIVGSIKSKELY